MENSKIANFLKLLSNRLTEAEINRLSISLYGDDKRVKNIHDNEEKIQKLFQLTSLSEFVETVIDTFPEHKEKLNDFVQLDADMESKPSHESANIDSNQSSNIENPAPDNYKNEFVNRTYELEQLKKPTCPPYVILNDPAGYGKTFLLRMLVDTYPEKTNVQSIYIDFKDNESIRTDSTALIEYMLNSVNPKTKTTRSLSIKDLTRMLASHLTKPAVLLIFDSMDLLQTGEEDAGEVNFFIWENLVPSLEERLKESANFRVIFAGRYIKSAWKGRRKHHLKKLFRDGLTPFGSSVVKEALQGFALANENFKKYFPQEKADLVSLEIVSVTGGHPKCIMQILHELDGLNFRINLNPKSPDYQFSLEEKKRMVETYVNKELEIIFSGVGSALQDAMMSLSVFRGFNANTIQVLIDRNIIKNWDDSASALLAELTDKTHLITYPGRFPLFADRVVRLMLASKLQIIEPTKYIKISEIAFKLYTNWIKGMDITGTKLPQHPTEQLQIVFIIEGLFHLAELSSLKNTPTVKDSEIDLSIYLRNQLEAIKSTFGSNSNQAIQHQIESALESDDNRALRDVIVKAEGENGYDRLMYELAKWAEK